MEKEEEDVKIYTVRISSMVGELSFRVPRDQQPPSKIRLICGSTAITVLNFVKQSDSYVQMTNEELERFERGFKTGECRHIDARETGDERCDKRLAKLQKKLKEKKTNHCSYCEEYGGVVNIAVEQTATGEITCNNPHEVKADDLTMSIPEAVSLGPTSVQISWEESVINNKQLDNCTFEVQMSKSKNTSFHTIYSGLDQTFTQTDLLPGTKYYFSIRAIKDAVEGPLSPDVSVLTDATAPSTPDPPYISNKSKSNLVLKWTIKSDNGSPITSYTLQCDAGCDEGSFKTIFEGLQKQYKFSHKLAPMESCRFQVKAVNKIGESNFSGDLLYTMSASVPSTPDPPTVVKSTADSLHLCWKKPNSNGAEITEYTLQMEDHNKGYGFLTVYRGGEEKYVIGELKRSTEYKFRLSAVNGQGDSKWSDVITASTTSQAPACPSAPVLDGKVHTKSFAVAWAPPQDDGGSEIISYTLQINDGKNGPFHDAYSGLNMNHKFQDLRPGHTYKIRVRCTSTSLPSPWSDITNIKTCPVVPDSPSLPRQVEPTKPYTIELQWDPPVNNGGANIINYNVQIKDINSKEDFKHIYLGQKNVCCASGLAPNSKYIFHVRAQNRAGDSKFSDVSVLCTGPAPPEAVTQLNVTVKSSHVLNVCWKIPKDKGSPVTGYQLEWSKHSTGSFEKLYSGVENSYEIKKNIIPSTVYFFKVQASSKAGFSNWSNVVSCKTAAAPPGQVTRIKVAGQTSTSLMLQWQAPHDNGAPITSYNIDIVGNKVVACMLDDDDVKDEEQPRPLQHTLTGLKPHEQYRFRIQAVNKSGCGPFSSAMLATTKSVSPGAPVLEMVNSSYQSIKLRWKYITAAKNEASGLKYELQMKDEDTTSFASVFHGQATSHKVHKLQEQSTYVFRVRAANEAGYGPYSDVLVCQTSVQPPSQVKLKVRYDRNNTLTVTWNEDRLLRSTDHVDYILERQTKGSTDMKQLYEGEKASFTCKNLTPDQTYSFRVCAVRILPDGRRIQSTFSPLVVFTVPAEKDEEAAEDTTDIETSDEKSPAMQFTEKNVTVLVFIAFAVIVLIMALLVQFFV